MLINYYRSVEGTTPMHVACIWGKKDVLITLLQHGGDPFIKDQVKSEKNGHCDMPAD